MAVIIGALADTSAEFAMAIEVAASVDHKLGSVITREIALADAVTEGFARLADEPGNDIKVLVRPS